MRKSIVFYASWFEAIETLPKAIQVDAYRAIMTYGFKNAEIEEQGQMTKLIMTMVKPTMDVNKQRYENGCKGGEFGRLGGRPRKEEKPQKNPKKTPTKPLKNPNETPNDNVNDNDNNNNIKKTISNEIVKKSATKVATLNERAISFYKSLVPFLEKYDKEMIRAFYSYWSEPNQAKTKMRFEMERTWDTARRLSTWASREQKTLKNTSNGYKSFKQCDRDYQAEQYRKFAENVCGKLQHAVG